MSNEKRSYNTSRRIRKGYKERLNHLMLKRPLRSKTKVLADEYEIESPNTQNGRTRKIIFYLRKNLFFLFTTVP